MEQELELEELPSRIQGLKWDARGGAAVLWRKGMVQAQYASCPGAPNDSRHSFIFTNHLTNSSKS